MGSDVLRECAKVKKLKRSSGDHSFTTMGKEESWSDFALEKRYTLEEMDESEGLGSSCQGCSEDLRDAKGKCIRLNMDELCGFRVPLRVFTISKMSNSERQELMMRLRVELEKVQMFQRRVLSRNSNCANGAVKKLEPLGWNSYYMKPGTSGRFKPTKQGPHPSLVGNNPNAWLMKQCETLLKRLMRYKHAYLFNSPVDVVKYKCPDYFDVIKQPMDLGTIKRKLTSGAYSSPLDFVTDVRLTFTNAKTYNLPSNKVHAIADTMSKFFERGWAPIEKKVASSDLSVRSEIDDGSPEMQSKKRMSPLVESVKPRMTAEEKSSLVRRLQSFGDFPEHIIDFLSVHNDNQTSEDEIEIDIDSIGDDRLFELRDLLDKYMQESQSEHQVINESGHSNFLMHPTQGHELADEDVDIVGDDPPVSSHPPVVVESDAILRSPTHCSSSNSSGSSSSSSSHSSSRDSDASGSPGSGYQSQCS